MKKWLVYLLGVFTGIILAVILLVCIARSTVNANNGGNADGISLMGKSIPFNDADKFKVLQVLNDGALAFCAEYKYGKDRFSGAVVYIMAEGVNTFYDDQIISAPRGKRVVQVGTFQYRSKGDEHKTVPVIRFVE